MTQWEMVAAAVYFLGVAGSVVFVARRLTSRWWKYPEGIALLLQHVMLVGFGASAVVTLSVNQHYPGRVGVAIVLMLGFDASVWWLTILQEQARGRARRAAATGAPELPPAALHDAQPSEPCPPDAQQSASTP